MCGWTRGGRASAFKMLSIGQSNSRHDRWIKERAIIYYSRRGGGCPGGDDGLIALTREALIDAPLNYITGKIFRREQASARVPTKDYRALNTH